ncbi:unnamed protein product [Brassica oleracea]
MEAEETRLSTKFRTVKKKKKNAVYEANHKRTKANPFSSHSDTFSSTKRPYISALEDPFWIASMFDEYDAIITSGTFDIKPRPENSNILQPIVVGKRLHILCRRATIGIQVDLSVEVVDTEDTCVHHVLELHKFGTSQDTDVVVDIHHEEQSILVLLRTIL